jgi:2,3-bisphosphoglycerate-dependent phosphoglycerate mutase
MVEVWFIRHGETDWNHQGLLQGWSDIPLNALGESQARALGAWLKDKDQAFDSVYASDLLRATKTAWLSTNLAPQIIPALREINMGEWEGVNWRQRSEVLEAFIAFETFEAPSGETTKQLTNRVVTFLDGLPTGVHACFSHGGTIRAVLRTMGLDQRIFNCSVVGINWSQKQVLFVRHPEGIEVTQ